MYHASELTFTRGVGRRNFIVGRFAADLRRVRVAQTTNSTMNQADSMASSVGVMHALRTGNPIVDMLIAMSVPVLFKFAMDAVGRSDWWEMINALLFFWSPYYTRELEHKVTQNNWGHAFSPDKDQRNNVLIKAIQLYLDDKKLDYRNANVMLMSTKQESTSIWADSDDEGENTPAGKLKRFKVARKPPKNRWQLISDSGTPKVELMVTEHEEDKGEKAEKTQLKYYYRFRSRQKGAIDALIDKTYSWYIAELKKQEDNSRYLYEMQLNPSSKSGDDDGNASRVFKRYKLSDEKQFSSLFFDEKEKLLGLLKHFVNRTGKYAVQGYPHKFGLLLHGPPGTGKTSLIKALAQHTGRSIVNVPLARITTNQELMDIMFDQVTGRHRHHHRHLHLHHRHLHLHLHHHHHLRNLLLPLELHGDGRRGADQARLQGRDLRDGGRRRRLEGGAAPRRPHRRRRGARHERGAAAHARGEGEPRRRRRADAVAAAALLVGRRREGTRGGAHGQIVAAQGGGDRPGKRARGGGGPADAEAA